MLRKKVYVRRDIFYYYCPLNPKTTPLTFRKTEVWLSAYHGQAPFVKYRLLWRWFRYIGKHMVQVCVWLIEEFFKIQVIHKHNPHHGGQPGKAPAPFQRTLQQGKQEIGNQCHPYLDFYGVCAFTVEVSQGKVLFYLLEKRLNLSSTAVYDNNGLHRHIKIYYCPLYFRSYS